MSGCVNQPLVLDEKDITAVKEDICLIEGQIQQGLEMIEQTQLKVAKLTKELKLARARIAPIRKVPFDILSQIFQMCGKGEWIAPLRLGSVCKWWREVIQLTPRAWCFFDLKCRDKVFRQTYFERSGPFNLHVRVREEDDIEFLAPVAHRIQCMTIQSLPEDMQNARFPSLQSLFLPAGPPYADNVTAITTSYFPNLRYLEIGQDIPQRAPCPDLPPLRGLVITVHDDGRWSDIVQACSSSLISIAITYARVCRRVAFYQFSLPALRYFAVIDTDIMDEAWSLYLTTPILETYIEECEYGTNVPVLHKGTESVRHARSMRLPPTALPQLCILQLDVTFEDFRHFFEDLELHKDMYPRLEVLEFGQTWMEESQAENSRMVLSMWEGYSIPTLKCRPSIKSYWTSGPIVLDESVCGDDMACTSW